MDLRLGAYAVIVDDGRILLTHWVGGRAWTLPGGGVEPGESPADAAEREVFEETGHTVELLRVLGVDNYVIPAERRMSREGVPLNAVRVVYEGAITGGTLTNEKSGSSDEARWFPIEELAELPLLDLVRVGLALLEKPGAVRV
ncbi:NUDIX hydrolase [Herbiconiux sp. SYSU D00978]|uniref:NUDIX hydrolase n=1 Tax=Herbiconiux sp. SYSU D00978 TaxID=2812562 RepID=UPI001A958B05|nr:NUDIX hydrolase [Herbiconiux sp. SYSU D00978]